MERDRAILSVADLLGNQHYAIPHSVCIGTEREHLVIDPRRPQEMGEHALPIIQALAERGWAVERDSEDGPFIAATSPDGTFSVMTDAGRSVIELAPVRPCHSLGELEQTCRRMENEMVRVAQELGLVILGTGRHPFARGVAESWAPKKRYRGLQEVLLGGGHETCETASHQDTIDATDLGQLMLMANLGCALSGPIAALTANSSVFHGAVHPHELASRVQTWQRICHPEQLSRTGMPVRPFQDIEDYAARLVDLPYLFHLNGDGTTTPFNRPFWQAISHFGDVDFRRLLQIHIACVWWDARIRLNTHASVEFRVPCAQPQGEGISVSALHYGLVQNPEEAFPLMLSHSWEEWRQARIDGSNYGLNCRVGKEPMVQVVERMLKVAEGGLAATGDAAYLAPLYRRVRMPDMCLPAKSLATLFSNGIDAVIESRRFRGKP